MVKICGQVVPLLKLIKFLLTLLRGIFFLIFIWIISSAVPSPTASLIAVFVYSFRFTIGLSLSLLYILLRVIAFCCSDDSKSIIKTYKASRKIRGDTGSFVIGIFKLLLWHYTDYPCLNRQRYGTLIFDCVRYGLFALSVPIIAGVEYGLLAKEGKLYSPHVSALILFMFYFIPLTAHFIIELIRLIQTRKMDKSI